MGLEKVELENFKSYAGIHTIGPFDKLTCVVGPNGSGKSNIMDAIAFALGVSSTTLRTSSAGNCIHNGCTSASVKVFIDGQSFRRHVTTSGKSTYFHDGKLVGYEEYAKGLSALGLDLKLRNFMVFQGDIHEIANKTPKELCEYFEVLSGSIGLKKEYEEVASRLSKDLAECAMLYEQKKGVLAVMREEKEEKKQIEEFKKNVESKALLEKKILNLEVKELKGKLNEVSGDLEKLTLRQEEADLEVKEFEKEVVKRKEEVARVRNEYSSLEETLQDLRYRKMNEIREMAAVYKSRDRENLRRKENERKLKHLQDRLEREKRDLKRLDDVKNCTLPQNDASNNQISIVSDNVGNIEVNRNKEIIESLRKSLEELYSKMGDDLKKYEALEKEEGGMNRRVYEIVSELLKVRASRKISLRRETTRSVVGTLMGIFPGVHGLLVDLVRPTQKKYYSPVLNILQGLEYAVVVDSDTTALTCISYIKEKRLCKMAFLPLRTLKKKEVEMYNEKDFRSALLCVSYDDRYARAVQMALGDSIIADTKEVAMDLVYVRGLKANVCSLDNFFIRSKGRVISTFKEQEESEESFARLVEERKDLLRRIKTVQDEKAKMSRIEIVKERIKVYEERIREYEKECVEKVVEKVESVVNVSDRKEFLIRKIRERIRRIEEEIQDLQEEEVEVREEVQYVQGEWESEIRKYDFLVEKKRLEMEATKARLEGVCEEYKALIGIRKEVNTNYLNLEAYRSRLEEEIEERLRFAMLEEIPVEEVGDGDLHSLREELASTNRRLNEMVPTIKSRRKAQDYNTILQDYEEAKHRAMDTRRKMNDLKRERRTLFMACFDVVSSEIGRIYQEISNSDSSRGNAYLVLDNPTEPYLEGIRFHVMPPTKRFREIGFLSGGEKSMAILSLMFSINRYRPVPFFILDEFDSALDKTNVSRMVDFFVRADVQFLIISLKPILFQHADSLIGVYRVESSSSRILTLRL